MNPRPKVIFHLGFQKTGTTSIQLLLNTNKDLLSDIDVRAYGDATKDLRVAGRNFCANPTSEKEKKLADALESHFSAARDSGKSVCLISDENILGRVPFSASGDVISWATKILPMIESAASGVNLEFHFYIRKADSWRESIYHQCVKRAGVYCSYENWVKEAPFPEGWPNWEEWSRQLVSCVSAPVSFTSMDEELKSGAILGTGLLRSAGVSPEKINQLTAVHPQNPALSSTGLEIMRLVNRLPIRDRWKLRISERVEKTYSKARLQ